MTISSVEGMKLRAVDGHDLAGVLATYVERATDGLRPMKQKQLNNYIPTTGIEDTSML
jgi:hypothetical protein